MISAQVGRRWLVAIVLIGFVLAFGSLVFVGRDGAISSETGMKVSKQLFGFYLPLIGILAGFYFSELAIKEKTSGSTSMDTFVLSIVLVGLWIAMPPVLLFFMDTVDAACRFIDMFSAGGALSLGALTFYFSKSTFRGKK